MNELRIYTDGSCQPNPGPGAWSAIILLDRADPIKLSGSNPITTNNGMELTGLLKAMEWMIENKINAAAIHSDSQYALGCVQWAVGWEKKGWTKKGGAIKNLALVRRIHFLNQRLVIDWQWVRGHNGHEWNEMADRTAESARKCHAVLDDAALRPVLFTACARAVSSSAG